MNAIERGSDLPKRDAARILTWVALVALLHCGLWFHHYGQTALGESPGLDNRQTLLLAEQMATGTLAKEPFHRAPLYPFILSGFLKLGLSPDLMPAVARWLNALALALTAALSALVALRLWGRKSCAWVAGLLVAFNPVLLFFAGDAFDILLATACLTTALAFLQSWLDDRKLRQAILVGVFLALGSALRSHLLPLAILWPLAALFLSSEKRTAQTIFAATPLALSFILLGLANLQTSGEFRMTPWQAAYNLWAGNKPEASGRIYAQTVRVKFGERYDNPAKLESIALYELETGAAPPHPINEMNAYWKNKFFQHIAENPLQWSGLMLRKAYYLLNSYEQYDNKTYSFHRRLYPQLKYNPIHWGLLLTLAVCGALLALRNTAHRKFILLCIVIFGAYAAGTILFYTSNRFRVPMVPLLSILASGSLIIPHAWRQTSTLWKYSLVTCVLLALSITYSGFFNARDKSTWQEDHALIANASLRTGRDTEAMLHAEAALQASPLRADMHATLSQAHFNQWALSAEPKELSTADAEKYLQSARLGASNDPNLAALEGVYLWKLGHSEAAVQSWQQISERDALARLCLFWTGNMPTPSLAELQNYLQHPSYELLAAASSNPDESDSTDPVHIFMNAILQPVSPIRYNDTPDKA